MKNNLQTQEARENTEDEEFIANYVSTTNNAVSSTVKASDGVNKEIVWKYVL